MVMIVQTYATAIPLLYVAGFVCFFTMFWTDKVLFLRHYKNPPLYTKMLVINAIEVMEWGIPLHLTFGLFMVTNEELFDYASVNPIHFPKYAAWLGT
jgi:hypothetical protein